LILAQFAWPLSLQDLPADSQGDRKIFFSFNMDFFIYIGALWGQINMLSALLTFLAFYAVINKHLGQCYWLAAALKYILDRSASVCCIYPKNQTKKRQDGFALFSVVRLWSLLWGLAVYQWDTIYFLRTIFYRTPVFETANHCKSKVDA
jgi:hypothetical protein